MATGQLLTITGGLTVAGSQDSGSDNTFVGLTLSGTANLSAASVTLSTTVSGGATDAEIKVGSGTITDSGAWTNNSSDTAANSFQGGTGTVNLSGAAQTVSGSTTTTFNDLTLSGSGTKTFSGSFGINGDLTNNATLNQTTGTATFGGTSAQTISGAGQTFSALTLNNAAGASFSGATGNTTVSGALTLTSGALATGSNKVVAGSTSRTGGFVNGNLQKNLATGSSTTTFEVGSGTTYAPATVVASGVTTAGGLTVSSTGSEHPSIASSGLDPNKDANRYWTLTSNGVAGGTYSPTFTFVSGDLDSGVTTSSFRVAKFAASAWALQTAGTATSTTTQATGVSGFGDFAVGQIALTPPTVTGISPTSGPTAGGTSITITGTNLTGATAVKFGSVNATTFNVTNATTATATAPATITPGAVDVTVTSASGTSATGAPDKFTYNAATPTVSAVAPTSGPTGGATSVTITGTGFVTGSTVAFGANAGTGVVVNSATSITATAPAGAAGAVDVKVTNSAGTSSAVAGDTYTYVAAPAVAAVNPTAGPTTSGASVVITGSNFTNASSVKFGSTSAVGFTVNNDGQITASAPNGTAGNTVDVTVTTIGGTSATSAADHYTFTALPAVSSVSPNQGPATGGTSVTITGTNLANASAVTFNGVNAASFTVNSATSITATSPVGSAGTIDVRVATPGGNSTAVTGDHFTYVAAPAVSAIAPATGPTGGGTQVVVTGSNFSNASAVQFGGVAAATFVVNSATSITAYSPAGLGTVDVTVTTVGGTSTISGADQFVYDANAFPTVSSVSPSVGTTAGSTSVTITGTNFTTGATVSFGGVDATIFNVVNATTITATAPAQAAGLVDVTVSNSIATSLPNGNDHFTYVAPPSVSAISPAAGSSVGGTVVTISGANFTSATAVKFGSASASFSVTNDSTISATAPAGTVDTAVDVTVVSAGGTSSTSSADKFTYATTPSITNASPSSGPMAGGTAVTLTGSHFSAVTSVQFGSTSVPFTVVNPTTITTTTPSGTGVVDITVTNVITSVSGVTFAYVAPPIVTSVSPVAGSTVGGTSVTIRGTGFVGVNTVSFGTTGIFSYNVTNSTTITATAPTHAAGVVDVTVTTDDGGQSPASSADLFTYAAAVSGVTSSAANATYGAGASIPVQVTFTAPVTVTGTPVLALNSGGSASYTSGSGTSTLTFTYVVGGGQSSNDLDESSASALTLSGGSIQAGGIDAIVTVPAPGASGSLGASKNIVVDSTPPTITNVTSSAANGTWGTTAVVPVTVTFSENVIVSGATPTFALNSGATVNYSSGSGTSTLTFNYTVAAGQSSADLDATSTSALTGTIKDGAGNASALVLPTPGGAGSLGANKAIVIDTAAHTCAWSGASSTTWGTAANWNNCANVAPQPIDSVAIPSTTRDPIAVTTTVAGVDIQNGGLLTSSGSTTLNDTGDFTIESGGAFTFSAGAISVGGNLTDNGTLTPSSGTTVTMTGDGSQIGGSVSSVPFRGLTINPGAGGVVSLAKNISFASSTGGSSLLTVSSGTLDLSTFTASVTGSSGTRTFTLSSGATLKVGGASNFPSGFATNTLSSGSTVDYDAAGNQTVSNSAAYGTLKISGSGTKTLAGTTSVAGNLDIEGGTLDLSTFTANRSSNNNTLTVASGAGLRIGSTNGFPTNYATHSLDPSSTVEYAGTNQTVAAETYGNLKLSGTNTKTAAAGTTSVQGDFTLAGPTFAPASSTYVFNGAAAQTINGAPTFANLTVNNAAGLTLASGNVTVSGQLGLTAGVVATGANAVIANGSVSGGGSGSYVNGKLTRAIATGSPSVDFAIGDGGSYTPLTAAFASVSGAGSLTASTNGADHAAIASSDLDPANDANRVWTLTPGGALGFSSYNVTTNYAAGDLDSAATPNLFVARNYSGGVWNAPAGGSNAGASSVTGNGFTGTGDFVVGALYDTVGPVTSSVSAAPALTRSAPSVTAQADDLGTHTSNVVAAEFFIDTVGANGTGTAMAATDGAFDSTSEALNATLSASDFSALADGQHTIYVHAKDASNNWGDPASTTFTKDTTAPSITTPGNRTAEATGPDGALVSFTAPSATDAIDGVVSVLCGSNSGDAFPIAVTTVHCVSTDAAGNVANASFDVTVQDTTAPVVTVPSDLTREATGPDGATATFSASASDLVDGNADVVTCTPDSDSVFALGTTQVDCSATDAANNTGSASFNVIVHDTTAPVVSVPSDLTVEATGSDGATATFSASASDLVDGGVDAVSCVPDSDSVFALGTTQVDCAATDAANNTGSASFNVLVQDTTAPHITTPGDLTAEATSADGAAVAYAAPSASDAVDGTDVVTCSNDSGDVFPLGTTTVDCSTVDHAGNDISTSFDVLVQDTTAPHITASGDVTAEATSADGAVVNYDAATATDAVDGTDTVTCVPNSGDGFPLGTTEVDCTTTDAAGNDAAASFNVLVQDTTAPAITVPSDIAVEASDANGAVVDYTAPSATDAVDGTDLVNCSNDSGEVFPLGTTEVDCTATDAAGNIGTASFNVSVGDTTPPVLTVPSHLTLEATGPDGAVATFTPTASDTVDGTDVVTCSPVSGSVFALGTTAVDCSATDAAGNIGTASFNVKVQDTTAPVITVPSDQTAEATAPGGAVVNFTAPSATDAVDGTDTVICGSQGGDEFPLGTTTVNCLTIDAAGNGSAASFTVTVQDTTAPVITTPGHVTAEATSADGATVNYTAPSAADAVDVTDVVSCSNDSGDVFPLGTTTVDCSTVDAAGNDSSTSFTVTVVDTTAPAITVPDDIAVEAADASGATVNYTVPSSTDAVDVTDVVSCSNDSGDVFPLGTTAVDCSATDAAGNTGTASFNVSVGDTTPPVVTVPTDRTAEATSADGAIVTYTAPSASDAVDGTDVVACSNDSGDVFPLGTTAVDCSATDAAGNTGTASFNVTVEDTTAPVITTPGDLTAEATSADGAVVDYTAPSATDAVDGTDTVLCGSNGGDVFPIGTTEVDCVTSDAAGNPTLAQFNVTVQDTTAPVITTPGHVTAEATSADGATVNYTAPSAADAVDVTDVVSCSNDSGDGFPLGTTTVSCSTVDNAGNDSSTSFTVTVVDTTAPAITVPSHPTAEATGASGAVVNYTVPSSTDAVDVTDVVSCSNDSGDVFPIGTTAVDCSATDAAGNIGTASFNVSVGDTTPPVVTVPTDRTAEATGASGAVVNYTAPSATDDVDGTDIVTCSNDSGDGFAIGTTEVDCSATDAAGNTGTASFNVTVDDTTAPVVSVPSDVTVEATSANGATVNYAAASATDIVDGTDIVTCSNDSGDGFAVGTTEVDCSATDAAGNTGTASFNVTVEDTTAPVITTPGNLTAEATSADGAVVDYTAPSAADAVDGTDTVLCGSNPGDGFPLGATTVNCITIDAAGNDAAASFTVTVHDTTAPHITTPGNLTAEATSADGAVVDYTAPSATDAVDGTDAVTCSNDSGDGFPLGTTTVSCATVDNAGNDASTSFTVTVGDATAPVVTVPSHQAAEATGASGSVVTFTAPSASDAVDGTDVVTCSNNSGDVFPIGTTEVDCSATDAAGNTGTASFTVTVGDATAPVVTVPSDQAAEATGASGAVVNYTAPTATDTVDGSDVVACSKNSGDAFPLGTTTVNCTTSDAAGNHANASFHVTVQDTTAPHITVPANQTVEASGGLGSSVGFPTPTATDLVDGTDPVLCGSTSGGGFPMGTTTVNCSSTDAAGNTSHASFTVTVQDTTAPHITVPANQNVAATSASGAVVNYTAPSATDAVDGTDAVTCGHNSGDTFPIGTTTVNCSSTDAHGNTGTASFTVTVNNVVVTTPSLTFTSAPQTVGATLSTKTITVQRLSGAGVAQTSGALVVHLSSSAASGTFRNSLDTTTITTATIANGASTVTVRYRDSQPGSPTITASVAGYTSATQGVTVMTPKLVFTTSAQSMAPGATSGVMTVQRQAYDGTPMTSGAIAIRMASSAGTGSFRNSANTGTITMVTISDGQSSGSFRYHDTAAGTPTITVTNGIYTPATQTVTIAVPPALVFTTAAMTTAPSVSTGPITIQRRTSGGTPITTGSLTVSLAKSASSGSFRNAGDSAAITSVTIANGSSSVSFRYRDSAVGSPKITVSASGYSSASQTETIKLMPKLVFTTTQKVPAPNATSGAITIRRQSSSGSAQTSGSLTVQLHTSSTTGQFVSATTNAIITTVTIPSGASTASFRYRDSASGVPTITVSATGYVSAGQVERIDASPTISGLSASYTTARNAAKTISFTVGDIDQGANAVTLSGSSSNSSIVQSISFSGSGSARSIKLTPKAGKSGTVTITVTASDGFVTTTKTFTLKVG
ncbi:MAG TPA: HYR domain-containing protein [Acidimicrobiia bacterium]|nr:HYR domain-containing protein [Acidimicrobiia bacterium]